MAIFRTKEQAVKALTNRIEKFKMRAEKQFAYNAAEIENQEKRNAPWTDRTGNARNTIYAFSERDGDNIEIFTGIGIEYGKYLEVSNQKKFAIIKPTVDEFLPKIKRDIINLGV